MTGCQGQDWASYQVSAPSTFGLGFVFVKATEGVGYVNPRYAAQIAHARAAGLVVGAYHYPHMSADPEAEVAYFLAAAKPQPGDVLTLDWEGYDPANKGVPFSRQIAYKDAFLAHLAAAMPHNQVGTYCNGSYLAQDPNGAYGDFLWIATAKLAAGLPGIKHDWLFHQYGTAGGIDHDYCPLNPTALRAWSHAKENQDMPLTDADKKAIAQEVVSELLSAQVDDPTTATNSKTTVRGMLWTTGMNAGQANAAVKAQAATIKTLAGLVGSDVDTAAVVDAVEQAIATEVVHVDVNVTGPAAP